MRVVKVKKNGPKCQILKIQNKYLDKENFKVAQTYQGTYLRLHATKSSRMDERERERVVVEAAVAMQEGKVTAGTGSPFRRGRYTKQGSTSKTLFFC